MKLYIIAGEASGDLHGSNLMKALYTLEPSLQCRVWGGDLMESAGGALVKHYRDLAFMGFWEVLTNLRTILGNLDFCKKDILQFQPDALVLIDYPGFNLRMAKWAKKQGIKVIYYISPQIWAWHTSRVHAIRRDVDKMLVILPFEKDFYQKYGMDVEFVGHPLLDGLASLPPRSPLQRRGSVDINPGALSPFPLERGPGGEALVALLPGSRRQEVSRILPRMLEVTNDFPGVSFVIAGATSLPDTFYQTFLAGYPAVSLVKGETYSLLQRADAALVKSGTSTLETALIGTPQVVCYAGSPMSYAIARRVVQVPYISLVNLVLNRPLVKELIQDNLNRNNLRLALEEILDTQKAAEIRAGYDELRTLLGSGGASERAAKSVLAQAKSD
ncbi:MAG: lipid-A-disaccharide synthase [Saprospiraceae bacterium]|nr:lipid-A-disaccharide synthase [Saprospiraceae bacterium]